MNTLVRFIDVGTYGMFKHLDSDHEFFRSRSLDYRKKELQRWNLMEIDDNLLLFKRFLIRIAINDKFQIIVTRSVCASIRRNETCVR